MMSVQLQITLIFAVIIYFIIIIKLLKDKALSLKYTLLWLLAGFVMGILAVFPKSLLLLVTITGIQTPMYALIILCIAFILAILMSLTSIASRQNRKIRILVQESAILEKRIRELEEKLEKQVMP